MQMNEDNRPRYEIFVYNVKGKPGLEVTMYLRNYPTWHDMMSICEENGIKNCSDFRDIDNCLDEEVRVVYGEGTFGGSGGAKVLDYQIIKLSDIPTTYDELVLESGE